jgi:alpha-1,3-rhamnosyl/mannosyltransferase
MYRVTWVTAATDNPMGQQRYEDEIQRAMLRIAGPEWHFELVTVTSARSSNRAAKRIPMRLNHVAPVRLSRLVGRVLYGRPHLVHRFDLRLPLPWGAEVVTVHDLPPLRFSDEGCLTRSAVTSARRAARIIVPSTFAGKELVELIGVTAFEIIPYGVSDPYRDVVAATDVELTALGITTPFLLHAAGATQRKNLIGLADAWTQLSSQHRELSLVLCGLPDHRRDEAFGAAPRLVKTGRLEQQVLASLMRRASAVVVPSTYEGFGLPALEGMACGVPVVATARGALPEVCGDAALLVEPDGASIAAGIERVLNDEDLAKRLRRKGPARAAHFEWDAAAREHLRVYRETLSGRSDSESRMRP